MKTPISPQLDKVLEYFYNRRLESIMVHNIWRDFCETDKEFYILITDLESQNLVEKSSKKQYVNPAMNMYRITSQGVKIFETGGIALAFKKNFESIEKKEIRDQMEYQKLSDEIFDLRNRLTDYPTFKKINILSFLIGVVGLIVAIIALIK